VAADLPLAPTDSLSGGPLGALILERSRALGEKAYIECARDERGLSYRDLAGAVERWEAVLESAGVEVGSTVGLAIGDPIEFAVAFLGTVASGRWAAPLDPGMPAHGLGGLGVATARVGSKIVFADRAAPDGFEHQWVALGDEISLKSKGGPTPGGALRVEGASGGAILASSGTTGVPKVIPLPQHQLLYTARSVSAHHALTSNDRGFNSLPLFHINAEVVGLLASLVAGSCLVLDDRFHRTRFWNLMAERHITWINAVPAIISRLAEPEGDEVVPSRIRFIRSASAPLSVATSARFEANTGIPVVETYGMTEAASQITANPVSGPRKPGSVGLPVGIELRIVSGESPTAGAPADVLGHAVGHVEIRGPSVITAYGGDQHGDRFDVDGWLRTGDLGHFDDDGYLYLDARSDDVINRGGEKVFPREIEEIVLGDPDAVAVAVVGADDPELGQVPLAFLVLRGVDDESDVGVASEVAARIRDHLTAALVRSKRPVALNVVRNLPTGATGKLQRRALRDGNIPVIFCLDCR